MTKNDKLLLPVDLLETSEKVVPYVSELARRFKSEIHLLSVLREYDQFVVLPVPEYVTPGVLSTVSSCVQRQLYLFRDKYFKDFPLVEVKVAHGDVANEIIGYVKSEEVDLIVMETHARTGLKKFICGSITERVVRNSPVPVYVINCHMLTETTPCFAG